MLSAWQTPSRSGSAVAGGCPVARAVSAAEPVAAPRAGGWCDAGQMVFNMNVGGGQSIFAQSSSRVNELDAELRDKHTGKPAEDIKPLALLALRRIGVSLSDAELVAYADAVSRGEKFQFHFS
jgi:hypothetical protein